ncbi:Os06g0365200 [Oryza sativa Japonica Group]|uniref:Os06g0365200 protein n=1 Tax=Oryza sativa subsp. japonica TaxID=39947 RepID=Q0DCA0_ORYSJ|nr:Os06g0365200 [Oryza sativa Japonica Group]|eukprot:NP_001057609.1 Os06g0365200 [Oryza sativa Japonica Group]
MALMLVQNSELNAKLQSVFITRVNMFLLKDLLGRRRSGLAISCRGGTSGGLLLLPGRLSNGGGRLDNRSSQPAVGVMEKRARGEKRRASMARARDDAERLTYRSRCHRVKIERVDGEAVGVNN